MTSKQRKELLKAQQGELDAVLLLILYSLVGRRILYPFIAKFEYDAAKNYEHLIPDFPDVASVRDDETRHGDILRSLLKPTKL